jgi:hypothetical protein
MRNQPSGMGTRDGSNEMETADCDREADILPGKAAGLRPRLKSTSAGWRNGNRERCPFAQHKGMARAIPKAMQRGDTGAAARKVWQIFKADAKRSLWTAQYADDFGDFAFLKEANRGDACGASIEAGASVM